MWCGDAESWGGKRTLRMTQDGGKTWSSVMGSDGKPLQFAGADVSFSDPANDRILFASNLRSADGGKTWAAMSGCEGVYTASIYPRILFGKKGNTVVSSRDQGATWQTVAEVEGGIDDIGSDYSNKVLYVASQEKLKRWNGKTLEVIPTPRDQYGNSRVTTIAVDLHEPETVYVGGARNIYASHATICRTTDGGKTWTNLTMNTPLDQGGMPSPHEVGAIRVHPVTRSAWVAGQCYGMWKIAPPAPNEKGKSAEEASAPRAERPPLAVP